MTFIADILLGSGALAAAAYCLVLSRRLKRFTALETGMGSAIAILSAQVDEMTRALDGARSAASGSVESLEVRTRRAEGVAARLEILLASMHDLPEAGAPAAAEEAPDSARKLRAVRHASSRRRPEMAQ